MILRRWLSVEHLTEYGLNSPETVKSCAYSTSACLLRFPEILRWHFLPESKTTCVNFFPKYRTRTLTCKPCGSEDRNPKSWPDCAACSECDCRRGCRYFLPRLFVVIQHRVFPRGVFIKPPSFGAWCGEMPPSCIAVLLHRTVGMTAAKSYSRDPAKGASQNDTPLVLGMGVVNRDPHTDGFRVFHGDDVHTFPFFAAQDSEENIGWNLLFLRVPP